LASSSSATAVSHNDLEALASSLQAASHTSSPFFDLHPVPQPPFHLLGFIGGVFLRFHPPRPVLWTRRWRLYKSNWACESVHDPSQCLQLPSSNSDLCSRVLQGQTG
jgi:hypothetical protein